MLTLKRSMMTTDNNIQDTITNSYLFGSNIAFIEELYDAYLDNPSNVDVKWQQYFTSIKGNNDVNYNQLQNKFINLMESNRKQVNINNNNLQTTSAQINKDTKLSIAQIYVWQLLDNYRQFGIYEVMLDPLVQANNIKFLSDQLQQSKSNKTRLLNLLKNYSKQEFNVYDIACCNKSILSDSDNLDLNIKLPLEIIITQFENIYCKQISFEYTHINNQQEYYFLQQYIEHKLLNNNLSNEQKKDLLIKLTKADGLERYLNTKFVGQKRFSLEGCESLIPLLDAIITESVNIDIKELHIGMAHRGRLNVLVNINGKAPQKLFDEFDGNYQLADFVLAGDVKYHKGYKCSYTINNKTIVVNTLFNASHLESVNPILQGVVRARNDYYQEQNIGNITNTDNETNSDKLSNYPAMGIVIHGDSALIGLGTNQGMFNMSQTRANCVGGLIHIVINNQIGFTTSNYQDTRSSLFCTDLAKMINAPIIHLNSDNVENILFVAKLMISYRVKFHKDIILNLVCYRKYGHNEADDPSLTQPYMYRLVKAHQGIRNIYANKLIELGIVSKENDNQIIDDYRNNLENNIGYNADIVDPIPIYSDINDNAVNYINTLKIGKIDITSVKQNHEFLSLDTAITAEQLQKIGAYITSYDVNTFKPHPAVIRTIIDARKSMINGKLAIDFGTSEILAYGSLLNQGISVRLCGEDSERGTFSHRQAVWHNYNDSINDDVTYTSLKQLENNSKLYIYNSVLNEECALAFEYGYSIANLHDLVIWEAQFGDFVNGAQVIIDQYIASARTKWGILSNLVMMLPHGFDGQGPEHSSARLERFLQLSAENNCAIVSPTTAAQMFHILRTQALMRANFKPLIIFMSKKLLRSKDAASAITDFIDSKNAKFQYIIDDHTLASGKKKTIKKVILCSGQIYYELLQDRTKKQLDNNIAIIRIEQLYPLNIDELIDILDLYPHMQDVLWAQEEPYNQGAGLYIQNALLNWTLNDSHSQDTASNNKLSKIKNMINIVSDIKIISRDKSSTTACGLLKTHLTELQVILDNAIV